MQLYLFIISIISEKITLGVHAAKTLMVVSCICNEPIAEIARAAPGGLRWMQLYVTKTKKHVEHIISEAERAGFKALVVTVDSPVQPPRPFYKRHPRGGNAKYFTDQSFRWAILFFFCQNVQILSS